MLIKCPECELQISDKALACPHCGYPMADISPSQRPNKTNKRKRLPNGFGRITEIKNKNLRNRFRAMVTIGVDSNGKYKSAILKPQGYFPTYNDAYAALLEYNKNPYDLEADITVKSLYEKWFEDYRKSLKSDSSARTITSAWRYCSSVYDMRAADVRARHIKGCMDSSTSPHVKSRIKSLFNLMMDYALEYEIVDRNYARTFNISDDVIKDIAESKRGHMIFTDEEMKMLWDNIDVPYVDVVLIQCYGGWRPQELGLIRLKDVDLQNNTMIGGIKTDAGTNRLVPIHPKIKRLIEKRYDEAVSLDSEYLINCTDGQSHKDSKFFTYDKYAKRFIKIKSRLKLNDNHRPHDGRMHFITQAKKYEVDEYAIKYIVGHKIDDITEKVYTEREEEWLKKEMQKIKE